MAIAMILSLGLLLGSIKLMLWFSERFVTRQKSYEASRAVAGTKAGHPWVEPNTPLKLVDE